MRPDKNGLADGIVVTPSHNPPEDGGFKYNPPGIGSPTAMRASSGDHRLRQQMNEVSPDRGP